MAKTPFLGVTDNTRPLPTLPRTLHYPATQWTSPGARVAKTPFPRGSYYTPPSYPTTHPTLPCLAMDVPRRRVAKTPFVGVNNNAHPFPTLPRALHYPTTQWTPPGGAWQKFPFWGFIIIHTPFPPYHAANAPRGARGKNTLFWGLLIIRTPFPTLPRALHYPATQWTSPAARVAKTPFVGVDNYTHRLPTLRRTLHYPTTQWTSPGGAWQNLPFSGLLIIHTPFLPYHAPYNSLQRNGRPLGRAWQKLLVWELIMIHTPFLPYHAPYIALPRNGRPPAARGKNSLSGK